MSETLEERQAEMKARIEARKPRPPRWEDCREATHEDLVKSLLSRIGGILPQPEIPAQGWVYVIKIKYSGPVKIGMTSGSDPRQRLQQVSQGLPFQIELLGLGRAIDATLLEGQLHTIFEPKWIKGEWFNLDSKDLEIILNLPHFNLPECREAMERGL